jgi:AhpD family alkylhydroperoxidase
VPWLRQPAIGDRVSRPASPSRQTDMTTTHTAPRFDPAAQAGPVYAAMARLEERIRLDATIRELVLMRASLINGCAFCIDMHWRDARAAGESEARLALVGAWREAPCFDARERAALELTEAITLVADSHVPDDVWDRAAAVFDEEELAHLVMSIAAINFWNRVAVTARTTPASFADVR